MHFTAEFFMSGEPVVKGTMSFYSLSGEPVVMGTVSYPLSGEPVAKSTVSFSQWRACGKGYSVLLSVESLW